MPHRKTVKVWGYDCLGYQCDDDGNVLRIWCKTFREYSEVEDIGSLKKGVSKIGKNDLMARYFIH